MAKTVTKQAIRQSADMSRNTGLAGQTVYKDGYAVTYNDAGYATKAVKSDSPSYAGHTDSNVAKNGVTTDKNMWTDEQILTAEDLAKIAAIRAQGAAGEITWAEANAQANAIRQGYGYTVDQTGTVVDQDAAQRAQAAQKDTDATAYYDKTTDTYKPIVSAPVTTPSTGTVTGTTTESNDGMVTQSGSISSPITGEGAYPSFQEFLEQTGYDEYSAQTQAAIKAAVEQAVLEYNQQIEAANQDTAELARQAYINKMLGEKNLDQQLSASGYAGGMADSQRIAMEGNYQNQLNALEMQRQETVKELENAITNAQLSGDLQTAQELSAYLQELQGQWLNYVQNQQAIANSNYWNQMEMENTNYWNEQSLNAQKTEAAYTRALNLLSAGLMPDDDTLSAAGITKREAQNRLTQILQGYAVELSQAQTGLETESQAKKTGTYNNGSLTTAQVKQLQQILGVTVDGLWGSNSQAAAGGLTADEAWAQYGDGGVGSYDEVLADIQALRLAGESSATINNVIVRAQAAGLITNAQAMELRGSYVGSR